MIRAGKSTDAWMLVDILKERHVETRYHGHVAIDELAARRMFAQAAMRHGHTNEGGAFLMVNEREDGAVDAFIFGVLNRVYVVGDMLCASDVFLLGRRSANPRVLLRLFDAYVAWAEANPKVFEIGASWADTIPGNEKIIDSFGRRGFALCSSTFRREARTIEQQEAA